MIRDPGFWIGHPGALLPLPDAQGSLRRTTTREVAYKTSAGGYRRAYLAARRAPLRSWAVTIPHTSPDEAAILHGLLMETDPPYVWVDPWARATNLLTPRAAGLEKTIPLLIAVGRQPLEGGGYAPTGAANPTNATVKVEPAPVLPGTKVTVSAYLTSIAGGRVAAVFLDSNGATIGDPVNSPTVVGTDYCRRAFVTATPPINAAAVEIRIYGAAIITQPAVSWTDQLVEYGPGGGAGQVVLSNIDEDVLIAILTPGGQRFVDLSFTVTEVG